MRGEGSGSGSFEESRSTWLRARVVEEESGRTDVEDGGGESVGRGEGVLDTRGTGGEGVLDTGTGSAHGTKGERGAVFEVRRQAPRGTDMAGKVADAGEDSGGGAVAGGGSRSHRRNDGDGGVLHKVRVPGQAKPLASAGFGCGLRHDVCLVMVVICACMCA